MCNGESRWCRHPPAMASTSVVISKRLRERLRWLPVTGAISYLELYFQVVPSVVQDDPEAYPATFRERMT
jgi:hypothetical protein